MKQRVGGFPCLFVYFFLKSQPKFEFTNHVFSVILIYSDVEKGLRAGVAEDAVKLMNEKGNLKSCLRGKLSNS